MAIPVWSTPRDSLNRFNLVFSRCPYEESPSVVHLLSKAKIPSTKQAEKYRKTIDFI